MFNEGSCIMRKVGSSVWTLTYKGDFKSGYLEYTFKVFLVKALFPRPKMNFQAHGLEEKMNMSAAAGLKVSTISKILDINKHSAVSFS